MKKISYIFVLLFSLPLLLMSCEEVDSEPDFSLHKKEISNGGYAILYDDENNMIGFDYIHIAPQYYNMEIVGRGVLVYLNNQGMEVSVGAEVGPNDEKGYIATANYVTKKYRNGEVKTIKIYFYLYIKDNMAYYQRFL